LTQVNAEAAARAAFAGAVTHGENIFKPDLGSKRWFAHFFKPKRWSFDHGR